MTDFSEVPVAALCSSTKFLLSTLLNPLKVIPNENNLPRDWRGLADLCGVAGESLPALDSNPDPTACILDIVSKQKFSVLNLQNLLEKIGRWDIIEETESAFTRDAQRYLERPEKKSAVIIDAELDNQILTFDDQRRLMNGEDPLHYDAFLLYADEDSKVAADIIESLETQYNLTLCDRHRDVINSDLLTVTRIITERCNRLIVILTPSFLKSNENKFLTNYTQGLSIDQGSRKVVSCTFGRDVELPLLLKNFYTLDKNRCVDFHKKLYDSVRCIERPPRKTPTSNEERKIEVRTEPLKEANRISQIEECPDSQPLKIDTPDGLSQIEKKKIKISSNLFKYLPWNSRKEARRSNEAATESLELPSLEDLDNLESSSSEQDIKKKKKTTTRSYAQKFKSLVAKS